MSDLFCQHAGVHEPETVCEHCNLPADKYGNTEADFLHCSFPDCGCDGARLCMARHPNDDAVRCNVEGMYDRKDQQARMAKIGLVSLVTGRKEKQ